MGKIVYVFIIFLSQVKFCINAQSNVLFGRLFCIQTQRVKAGLTEGGYMVTLNMHFDSKKVLNRRERVGCRCILFRDDEVLLVYETNTDTWMTPGGGLEGREKLADCCAREMAEETGLIVSPIHKRLTINEYYDDRIYISHYFDAEYVRETERQLTNVEQEVGTVPRWIKIQEAIAIFSKFEDYKDTDIIKMGLYRREGAAISYFDVLRRDNLLTR